MIAIDENVRVIDKAPAAEFLQFSAFRAKVAEAFGITLDDLDNPRNSPFGV